MFPNVPKIPGVISTLGGTDTWYDRQGNQITPDPYNHMEIFDAMGKRHVFAGGTWGEDDPRVSPLFPYVMGALASPGALAGGATGWALASLFYDGFGTGDFQHNQTYLTMNPAGNYFDVDNTEIRPDQYEWLIHRWGENPPIEAIEQWEAKYLGDIFDVDPTEYETLDDLAYRAATYNSQGLVKIGKPVKPGDTFYINGQRAVLGSKAPNGAMQYAVTEPGDGDRWKYKVSKDKDGNFVRTYYKTFGARRAKLDRQKEKEED